MVMVMQHLGGLINCCAGHTLAEGDDEAGHACMLAGGIWGGPSSQFCYKMLAVPKIVF